MKPVDSLVLCVGFTKHVFISSSSLSQDTAKTNINDTSIIKKVLVRTITMLHQKNLKHLVT